MSSDTNDESARQATLVAFLGQGKPSAVQEIVMRLQNLLQDRLGARFKPRPLPDVHATIIGLEAVGYLGPSGDVGALIRSAATAGVDLPGFASLVKTWLATEPVTIQFGGFADRDYPLTSRGKRLFERTITISNGQIILMGWPLDKNDEPLPSLNDIRWRALDFGIRHRYFDTPTATDPDAYLVLGEYEESADTRLSEVTAELRAEASGWGYRTGLTTDDLSIALYHSNRLPADTTIRVPLTTLGR